MDKHFINDDENIFDLALQLYGDVEYAIKLAQDNQTILSSVTQNAISNLTIEFDPSVIVNNKINLTADTTSISASTVTYLVNEGQSIFDLSLQLKGDIDKSYELIQETGIVNINKNIVTGFPINVHSEDIFLTNYLINKSIILNTSNPKIKTGSGFNSGFQKQSFF